MQNLNNIHALAASAQHRLECGAYAEAGDFIATLLEDLTLYIKNAQAA
jgi:hypothetical protein